MGGWKAVSPAASHYDNVAPCFLGGMQLMIENGIISQQVPENFDEWLWVLAYRRALSFHRRSAGHFACAVSPSGLHCAWTASGRFYSPVTRGGRSLPAALMKDIVPNHTARAFTAGLAEARRGGVGIGARWRAGFPGRGRRCCAICDKPETARSASPWTQPSKHYLQSGGFVHVTWLDTAERTQ